MAISEPMLETEQDDDRDKVTPVPLVAFGCVLMIPALVLFVISQTTDRTNPLDTGGLFRDTERLTWDGMVEGWRVGHLKVTLDPLNASSPDLNLNVLMRPANRQPAPLGTLLFHCGGPGSGKECAKSIVGVNVDSELLNQYNILGIDQRGVGGSEPNMGCPDHTINSTNLPDVNKADVGLSDFTNCPCENWLGHARFAANRAATLDRQDVWDDEYERFKWTQTQFEKCKDQPSFKKDQYNVADYMGTIHLAGDLNTFRKEIGADKLSIYGVSYGTWVGSVFASAYPQFTDKIVIDSNVAPAMTAPKWSKDYANNHQKMFTEYVRRCRLVGDFCTKGRDPRTDFYKAIDALTENRFNTTTESGKIAILGTRMLTAGMHNLLRDYSYFARDLENITDRPNTYLPYTRFSDMVESILNARQEGKEEDFAKAYFDRTCSVEVTDDKAEKCVDKQGNRLGNAIREGAWNCPIWKQFDQCFGIGFASDGAAYVRGSILFNTVLASDVPSKYGPRQLVDLVKYLDQKAGAIGFNAGHIMDGPSLWPVKASYPGIGTDKVAPLIVGVLDDSATAFKWTQEMKLAFPNGHLMTWQGFTHGIPTPFNVPSENQREWMGVGPCVDAAEAYLLTGTLPRNGMTCHAKTLGEDFLHQDGVDTLDFDFDMEMGI